MYQVRRGSNKRYALFKNTIRRDCIDSDKYLEDDSECNCFGRPRTNRMRRRIETGNGAGTNKWGMEPQCRDIGLIKCDFARPNTLWVKHHSCHLNVSSSRNNHIGSPLSPSKHGTGGGLSGTELAGPFYFDFHGGRKP